jgi:hypothetical protein
VAQGTLKNIPERRVNTMVVVTVTVSVTVMMMMMMMMMITIKNFYNITKYFWKEICG